MDIYHCTLHTIQIKCFKMVNLPLLLWPNIQAHICPLLLPKIAPFCMKITKKNSGGGPPNPPSITISLHTIILCIHEYINNKIKINHTAAPLTYILFAVVCKNMKKIENPVLPPF